MSNPFENIEMKIKTIKIGTDDIKVRLSARDAGKMVLLMKNEFSESDADRTSDIMLRTLKQGNPGISEEILDYYISEHYSDMFVELLVLSGVPRTSLDKAVKESKPKKKV